MKKIKIFITLLVIMHASQLETKFVASVFWQATPTRPDTTFMFGIGSPNDLASTYGKITLLFPGSTFTSNWFNQYVTGPYFSIGDASTLYITQPGSPGGSVSAAQMRLMALYIADYSGMKEVAQTFNKAFQANLFKQSMQLTESSFIPPLSGVNNLTAETYFKSTWFDYDIMFRLHLITPGQSVNLDSSTSLVDVMSIQNTYTDMYAKDGTICGDTFGF